MERIFPPGLTEEVKDKEKNGGDKRKEDKIGIHCVFLGVGCVDGGGRSSSKLPDKGGVVGDGLRAENIFYSVFL